MNDSAAWGRIALCSVLLYMMHSNNNNNNNNNSNNNNIPVSKCD